MVLKGQDFSFLVDQLDENNKEEVFKISVILQRNSVPVTMFMKEFLHEEEFVSEKSFQYQSAVDQEVKCSDSAGNKIKVKFSVSSVLGDNQYPFERDGLRLLVGRYVIYQKKIALLKAINRDYTIDVQNLTTGTVKTGVKMKNVKMIERNGVNIYSLGSIPKAIADSQYAWLLEFKTKSRRLVNLISSGIQNRHTFNAFNQRSYSRDKKRDIEGAVLVSIIETVDLKAPGLSLFVRISSSRGTFQTTSVSSDARPITWATKYSQYGQLFNLGTYFKEDPSIVKFQLYNKTPESEVLIGQKEMPLSMFIDIENPGQEHCLTLESPNGGFVFLVIQSLFVPNNVTRVEYQLMQDMSVFASPEHYFHFQYLLRQFEIDRSHFQVPLLSYNPNLPILRTQERLRALEESVSDYLRRRNDLRPEIEEGVLIFEYLMKQRQFKSRQQAQNDIQRVFWTQFMKQMQQQAASQPFLHEIKDIQLLEDGDVALVDYEDARQPELPGDKILEWIQKQRPQEPQFETKAFPLMFDRIWGFETSQAYADTYYLIQAGISDDLRVKIWRDFLKIDIIEYEERRIFKKKYSQYFNENKSVYSMYKDMGSKLDCLAFRQIEEDVENFEFPPLFCQDLSPADKDEYLMEAKGKMRQVLRVLILWSRNKRNEGQKVSFSYTLGLMKILQRLLTFADEEQAFWLLNGIVRMIPRLFSTDVSCLLGGRNSVMRNEMTAFKAILRENLPGICDKLHLLGLPIEFLIYDSLTSFYANYFSSDVVLRLWDLIVFNLSNKYKVAKKRALWYFMAPAYWILRERQEDILRAFTVEQVVDIYRDGGAITYNPDWIVKDIRDLIDQMFVTQEGQQKWFFQRASVDKAKNLEETRKKYEADLSLIFNSIEEENKAIALLTEAGKKGLDYSRWRLHIMDKFKKVAIRRDQEDIEDNLYKYEEAKQLSDLDLAKINVYLHSMIPGQSFKLKVFYGRIAEDGSFQTLEERFNDEESFTGGQINRFFEFEYLRAYNHLRVETTESELIIDLRELSTNRFLKRHFQMKSEGVQPMVLASFFLQSHTRAQMAAEMRRRNTSMSQFINSIKRKLPDRIDIFNKNSETEFVALLQGDFNRIVEEELAALSNFLPIEIARNTINDNYNYTEIGSFGNISLSNLKYLVKKCFFSDWLPLMDALYQTFVKEEGSKEDGDIGSFIQDEDFEVNKAKNMSVLSVRQGKSKDVNDYKGKQFTERALDLYRQPKVPFSLRNFLVSLVLMSHCTVSEKFDILYDMFDWNDGVSDGLEMSTAFLLIKTIFERNLYFWPSHELFNLVEASFDMSVSGVYRALWASDLNQPCVKFSARKDLVPGMAIDVTEEVQETLNRYQRMFGTKVVDFNSDSSAFKHLSTLIKGGSELLKIKGNYKLYLFYTVSSERFIFTINYDSKGELALKAEEKDDIDSYLKRNINKLFLQGRSKGIKKAEFMLKTNRIPFLQDLLRVETFYRDRVQSTLCKKKKLEQELVVLLDIKDSLFVFRFQTRVMHNLEGEVEELDSRTFRVLMKEAHEQDVISDIRERIYKVLASITTKVPESLSFYVKDGDTWTRALEFDRIIKFHGEGSEMVMKLSRSMGASEEARDLAGFDCYSLYRHCDLSYEWRLCKIMQKEPIINPFEQHQLLIQPMKKDQEYLYWIEFLHHRQSGDFTQKLWFKRRRDEVLFSARYAREQQRNYEQESLKFVTSTSH